MAKKKSLENKPVEEVPTQSIERFGDTASLVPSPTKSNSLLGDVQEFLGKRAELAKRLAEEIEATEQKLAELKETAALLFPECNGRAPKDKKQKKVKAKAASRVEESASEPPTAEAVA